jgi:heme-degrading monooxygenase HmoA
MIARIAIYSFTGDAEDLAKRAEAGILPILEAQPGFRGYSVAIGEGKVFSSSAWDSRAEAETGSAVVASWVAENMTEISLIGDVQYAEIAFSTVYDVTTA